MISQITTLIERYADAAGLSVTYASRLSTGSSSTVKRLRAGGGITIMTCERTAQWISDHWPAGAAWPRDIPRPPPTPDSPAAQVQVAVFENHHGESRHDDLDASGRVARPRDFVADVTGAEGDRLDGDMKIYRYVIQRYAGNTRGAPRRDTVAEDLLIALIEAGDARFAERRRLRDMFRNSLGSAA